MKTLELKSPVYIKITGKPTDSKVEFSQDVGEQGLVIVDFDGDGEIVGLEILTSITIKPGDPEEIPSA